jgi:hypothetical protein
MPTGVDVAKWPATCANRVRDRPDGAERGQEADVAEKETLLARV